MVKVTLKTINLKLGHLKQCDTISLNELSQFKAIGWCNAKLVTVAYKYIVLQDGTNIRRMLKFEGVTLENGKINIHYNQKHIPVSITEDNKEIFNHLNRILRESNEQGQFFI